MEADEGLEEFAVLEEEERGDAADAEFDGDVFVVRVLDAHLRDARAARVVGRDFFEDGELHFARAAPRCPEVNERDALRNGGVEVGGGELEKGVGHGRVPWGWLI